MGCLWAVPNDSTASPVNEWVRLVFTVRLSIHLQILFTIESVKVAARRHMRSFLPWKLFSAAFISKKRNANKMVNYLKLKPTDFVFSSSHESSVKIRILYKCHIKKHRISVNCHTSLSGVFFFYSSSFGKCHRMGFMLMECSSIYGKNKNLNSTRGTSITPSPVIVGPNLAFNRFPKPF